MSTRSGLLLFAAAALYYASYTARFAFNRADEGYLFYVADALNEGRLLYRDVELGLYPPELFHLFALAFRWGGRSIDVARYVMAAFLALNVLLVAAVAHRLAGRAWAAGAVLVVALVPGPWHKFFVATCFFLLLLGALRSLDDPRPARLCALGAAVGTGLYLRLDAFVVGLVLVPIVVFGQGRGAVRRLLYVVLGLILVSLPMALHLCWLGQLDDLGRQLLEFTGLAGTRVTAWYRLPPPPLSDLAAVTTSDGIYAWLFYGSLGIPVWQLLDLAGRLAQRRRMPVSAEPPRDWHVRLVLFVWLLGNIPQYAIERPDMSHLTQRMPALAVVAVTLAATVATREAGRLGKVAGSILASLVVAYLCVYVVFSFRRAEGGTAASARGPLTVVTLSNGQRFVQPPGAGLDVIVEFLLRQTRPGEAVATLPYIPGLNFLAARPLATSQVYLLPSSMHRAGIEDAYIWALETGCVRYVVLDEAMRFNRREDTALVRYAPRLDTFLREHYTEELRVGATAVLRRYGVAARACRAKAP